MMQFCVMLFLPGELGHLFLEQGNWKDDFFHPSTEPSLMGKREPGGRLNQAAHSLYVRIEGKRKQPALISTDSSDRTPVLHLLPGLGLEISCPQRQPVQV